MDYVFGTAPNLTREERAQDIVVFLKEKFDQFLNLRRIKYPSTPTATTTTLEASSPQTPASSLQTPLHAPVPRSTPHWRSGNPFSGTVPPGPPPNTTPPTRQTQPMEGVQFMPAPVVQSVGPSWMLPSIQGPPQNPQNAGNGNIDWVSCGFGYVCSTV